MYTHNYLYTFTYLIISMGWDMFNSNEFDTTIHGKQKRYLFQQTSHWQQESYNFVVLINPMVYKHNKL